MRKWGGTDPPEEAYGRVTDAGRFAPLHPLGHAVLDDLEHRFAVRREDFTEPDPSGTGTAPAVRLVPADPAAAALTIGFTAFPGLTVLIGVTDRFTLPMCGCDACDETVSDCADQLRERLTALTAGTHGERLVRADGAWWHERWYQAKYGESTSGTRLEGSSLAEVRAAIPTGDRTWSPWPHR